MWEASLIKETVQKFSSVSGQMVGPGKSSIWFSNKTSSAICHDISRCFAVNQNNQENKYLGAPIKEGRDSYDFIIDKFSSKLNAWKSRTLSQAGRIVLIKSVLQSLPVYFMGTVKFPSRVTKALTDLIRRFFWGALDKRRFLAYVAWGKISLPYELGRLGIRDLQMVNDSLLMKALFKVAKRGEAQWVQLVVAKYLPRSNLWHSARTSNCTAFWKSIMGVRDKLLPLIQWKLGDSETCQVYGQPWFEGATSILPLDMRTQTRQMVVNELIDVSNGGWNVERLSQLFGYRQCLGIVSTVLPPRQGAGTDYLIFKPSTNGDFSVKKAYNCISKVRVQQGVQWQGINQKTFWSLIWKKGLVQPRIRLFLWKLINCALPLGQIMAHRLQKGDPNCQVCGDGEEDVGHLMLKCPFSRSCWFGAVNGLRSDTLVEDPIRNIISISDSVSDWEWTQRVNVLWAIWRCRNERVYEGRIPNFDRFNKLLREVNAESMVAMSCNAVEFEKSQPTVSNQALEKEFKCFVDGSWKDQWRGGIGYIILKD